MSDVDKAYDALPAQETIGEDQWDATPESAALRALFGTSAYRLLGDSGLSADRHLDGAIAIQEKIAQCYLFAHEADRAKPVERCLFCGAAVTPGKLIGNTLANGAIPKMAQQAIRAGRLYTDELGALRKRVAELEALNEAGARAVDALESIGEQARERIIELARGLRQALDSGFDRSLDVLMYERLYRLVERSEAETPAGNSAGNSSPGGDPNAA